MNTHRIASIAALMGEPARTAMLIALMDGRALTAHELAQAGKVSAATASRHLALMVEADLLKLERQGRHRYHRLASPEVARLLEQMMQLSAVTSGATPESTKRVLVGPRDAALRQARTCYDHIAGRLGVAITEHLLEQEAIRFEDGETGHLTDQAAEAVEALGLPWSTASSNVLSLKRRRPLCRPCLDWSERRPHIAGQFGAMLCSHSLDKGWLRRADGSRALVITPQGAQVFRDWLGLERWHQVTGD